MIPACYFRTRCFLKLLAVFPAIFVFVFNSSAQHPLQLTRSQALDDFHWLRFSLEYVHPRLYKYDDKKVVDARFDSLEKKINNNISALDFLALVTKANARVRCGHLYTIPQDELAKELAERKVIPFYIKVIGEKIYLFNDCGNSSIPNGSRILSINGNSDSYILNATLPGIPADGYRRQDVWLHCYGRWNGSRSRPPRDAVSRIGGPPSG